MTLTSPETVAAGLRCPPASGSASPARYRTILADPPWHWKPTGSRAGIGRQAISLPYQTMTLDEICALPIGELAEDDAHLWLWTTNGSLHDAFHVMSAWGFRYLAPVTFVKPSGCGMWWIHRTQTLLHGYRKKLRMRAKYKPTVVMVNNPEKHSAKWLESYQLIEAVSYPPRIEIFARPWTPMFERRDGWDVWGNEVKPSVALATQNL